MNMDISIRSSLKLHVHGINRKIKLFSVTALWLLRFLKRKLNSFPLSESPLLPDTSSTLLQNHLLSHGGKTEFPCPSRRFLGGIILQPWHWILSFYWGHIDRIILVRITEQYDFLHPRLTFQPFAFNLISNWNEWY